MTPADERYTITGPNAWAVTATCALCDYKTAAGYATHTQSAINAHLATNHPAREVIAQGLVQVAECPAGHDYWALPRGADGALFDTWWDAHREHVTDIRTRAVGDDDGNE